MARFPCVAAFLFLSVFFVDALPTVRKETEETNKQKSEANSVLEAELGKLKQDGIAVQKSEQTFSQNVNGKTQVSKTEKEIVSDAKTGEIVAAASKTVTKGENGQQKEEAHVDVPAAGIHQDLTGADAENFELVPAEDVARYIFDTSDIDGVKTAVQTLVDKKKISKKAADSYVQEIRERLNSLHEQALKEMSAEILERRNEEDVAYREMVSMVEIMNNNFETEQALYLYAKKLYTAYRVDGDEYAKEILTQFTNMLQKEVEAGSLNESVQDTIYDIILRALKDVNEELTSSEKTDEAGEAPAPAKANTKSKLPKD